MTATIAIDPNTNDLLLDDSTGRFVEITGAQKLSQEIRDLLDSAQQEDDTGVGIQAFEAAPADQFSVRAQISKEVTRAIGALKNIHDTTQRGDRTPFERVSRITKLIVTAVQDGPSTLSSTDFAYDVGVLSVGGEEVAVSGGFGLNNQS